MSDSRMKNELRILVILCLEGQAAEQQYQSLNDLLKSDQDAFDYYLELIEIHHALGACDWRIEHERLCSLQRALEEFAAYEKTSPEIKIVSQKVENSPVQTTQPQKPVHKISKSSLFTLLSAAAAIILIFIFARFVPPATGFKVAVLSDSMNAKWAGVKGPMGKGSAILTSRKNLSLKEGYAKLMFNNHVQITIEGPAEFQILSEDKIRLQHGRLYAIVPPEAIGFMVTTQAAKVIDLGTEFGVEVNPHGDMSLHVMKGKTTLITGEKSNKVNTDVTRGIAKRVSAISLTVSDISCEERLFARDIDSDNSTVWREETRTVKGYLNWIAKSGRWSDGVNWDAGIKPDGTKNIRLKNGTDSVCTLNTIEKPVSTHLIVSNGQTLNIESGGYMGCGWSRFGWSTVNMTGNSIYLLNNDDLYIGYPVNNPVNNSENCIWTMSDTSTITINQDTDDGETLYIAQDNTTGTLKLIGSGITVNCDQFFVGYPRNPGFTPHATLEYVLDGGGVSTIHVGYRLYLSEGTAMSHLVLSAKESLPKKDLVLIETRSDEAITGDGVFDTLNNGPGAEGTSVILGGNRYTLTYQYAAGDDGCRNDVALVYEKQ